MDLDIKIPSGKVIGIGKVKIFVTNDFPYEIPTLSFIVSKNNKGEFISTCIHLLVEGVGETPDASMENLKNNIYQYLNILFDCENKDIAWEQLLKTFNDSFSIPYWDVYRTVQIKLAKKGISTDSKSALYEIITKLRNQINDLEEAIQKQDKFSLKIVDYKETA